MRKLVYLVAVSVDGFIADVDGRADFFATTPQLLAALFAEYPETCPGHLRDPLGVSAPPRHFDAVVMGMNTHRPALEAGLTNAYPHLDGYVVTHRRNLPADPSVTFVHEQPVQFVRDLKRRPGSDIWLCGGADLAGQLIDEIDELHLKVYPVLVGEGIPVVGDRAAVRPTSILHAESGRRRAYVSRMSIACAATSTTRPLRTEPALLRAHRIRA